MDSAATSAVTNVNDSPTGAVTITGTAVEDGTLTASNSIADEDGMGTVTYTWSTGATGDSITLGQSDVGTTITVTASYTDAQGTAESMDSAATSAVTNVNDSPAGSVTISGDVYDGETLTANNDLTDEDGIGTFSYQWADQDGAITGATSSTYTVGSCCDVMGDTYTVTITYTDAFGEVESVTSDATVAVTLNPDLDLDVDGIDNGVDTDIDGDGWINSADTFPLDSTEWADTDNDGIGNNADTDDDGDLVPDAEDDFPLDGTEAWDADGDGWGHNADSDDDGDGIEDTLDDDDDGDGWSDVDEGICGTNMNNYNDIPTDTDGDLICDIVDTDDDGDGYSDLDETTNCGVASDPLDATSTPLDTDGDLNCNELDTDDDNDGVLDVDDVFPEDATESTDYDGDGTGDNADTDDDADGVDDLVDPFPFDIDAWTDTDGDGLADDFPNLQVATTFYTISAIDSWDDGGHVITATHSDGTVLCTLGTYSTSWSSSWPADSCSFGLTSGTVTVTHETGESYYYELTVTLTTPSGTTSDISPTSSSLETIATLTELSDSATPSSSPAGTLLDTDDDNDGVSDADELAAGTDPLDTDTDDDGVDDATDAFPLDASESADTDSDGTGDNADAFPSDECADTDTDGDGYPDTIVDGCTTTLTEDIDDDGDGVLDDYDDFDTDATESTDTDGDGIGNNADTDDDGDGWDDASDWAPLDENEWLDTDNDQIGDNSDADDDGDGIPDGDDIYPRDFDNDGWDDSWELACGTDSTLDSSTPVDTDGDSVGDSGTVDSSTNAPAGVNLCDSIDTDDDNDGFLDVDDAFRTDDEVWFDTDNDGKADIIDPASTAFSYSTTQLCSISNSGTSATCGTITFAPVAFGETLELSFGDSTPWPYEFGLTVVGPAGTDTYSYTDATASYSVAGDYTITITDSYGDGGGYLTADYSYVSGSVPATVTDDGTLLDLDDDGDGYSDLDEGDAYDTGTAALCDDGSVYASSSNSLDSTSTPADMDSDYTCDALDAERDGDGYDNDVDAFPDDVNEWVDTDIDGIGNNADTDDDGDGTLDVDDVWSLLACASDDTDGDGLADAVDQSACDIGYTGRISYTNGVQSGSNNYDAIGTADGDYIGITNSIYNPSPAYSGSNYYTVEDTDGTYNLDFDYVTANSVSVAIVIESTTWEVTGIQDYIMVAFIGESATVVLYDSRTDAVDSTGTVTGDLDDSGLEDVWTVVTGDISAAGQGYLTVEMVSNSASEEFGIDAVIFTDANGDVVTQQDFENMGDAGVFSYPNFYGGVNTAHPNYGVSSSGVPKWICSDGSEIDIDLVNNGINDCITGVDESANNWYIDTTLENTPTATVSWGGDGVRLDSDDDNDGYLDWNDAFQFDGTEWVDTDGDGTGNNADLDDDADGVFDIADAFPLDGDVWTDTDGDGMADSSPPLEAPTEYTLTVYDSWGDGGHDVDVTDSNGNQLCSISGSGYSSSASCSFALMSGTADVTVDSDTWYYEGSMDITSPSGLSVLSGATWTSSAPTVVATLTELSTIASPTETPAGTMIDSDDDNDGYADDVDACPTQGSATFPDWLDNDGDGLCDNADTDDDNDGYADANDLFPMDGAEWADNDGDLIGDNADTDDDNDGIDDTVDVFPFDACASADNDGDGMPDTVVANCTTELLEDMDDDNDLVLDGDDLWPFDQTKSTDTDGDGLADFVLGITPGDSYDFETGNLTNGLNTNWTQQACTGLGNQTIGGAVSSCTPSTTQPPWTVSSTNPINGVYSLKSGQATTTYAEITVKATFYTTGGDATWNWKVSSFERTTTNVYTDGLKIYVNGVQIDASQYGGCVNGEWCGEDSGFMTWSFGPGTHTIEFTFDFGTGNSGGSSEAWIDDLQFPDVFVSSNEDLDDDNDGALDEDDFDSLDKCVSTDTDGDGIVDDVNNFADCDPADYTLDDDDDDDSWSDADEITCGSNALDNSSVPADFDGDLICDVMDLDDDNDGTADVDDAFPTNNTEDTDTDGDGIGDNTDTDDDGDGIADLVDAFPLDSTEDTDTDGDGTGDNSDDDIDNDGYLNADDAFPADNGEWDDTDSDGIGNNEDTDDDGDGVVDLVDQFPLDASESLDSDGDDIGDNTDTDDDGDGVEDTADAFPLDPFETVDTDGDGQGDNSDSDDDGDGINDGIDDFPMDATEWKDTDEDGIGDNTDSDDDGDDVADVDDAFPLNPAEWSDYDGDGVGDNSDTDDDGDSTPDVDDAFPYDITEWEDTDEDGIGNNADTDDDGDGETDARENECGSDPLKATSIPSDADGDGECDAIDDEFDENASAGNETASGFDRFTENLPGFTSVISTLALMGAAIGVGLSGRRKND